MADIAVNLTVNVNKSGHKDQFAPGAVNFAQTTVGAHKPIVSVGTAYESVPFGDVSTPGIWYGRNLASTSSTDYVEVAVATSAGSTTITPFGRIGAGRVFLMPLSTGSSGLLKWKASSGSINVDQRLLEA